MVRLGGWHRLWVVVSVLLPLVVTAEVATESPNHYVVHNDKFLERLSPEARSELVTYSGKKLLIDQILHEVNDLGIRVTMLNGHSLFLRKGVDEWNSVAVQQYNAIITSELTKTRAILIGIGLLWSVGLSLSLYAIGWVIGWIYRGFKSRP